MKMKPNYRLLTWLCVLLSLLCCRASFAAEEWLQSSQSTIVYNSKNVTTKSDEVSTDLTLAPNFTSTTTSASTVSVKPTKEITTTTDATNEIENTDSAVITSQDLEKLASIMKIDKNNVMKLQKISNKINKLIIKVDENQGFIFPEMLIDEFLSDPIHVKNIPVEKDDWISSYEGLFSNVLMYGIRNIKINNIKANIGKLNAKIVMRISQLYLTGDYQLDGTVSFVGINGKGPFHFNISDMDIEASGNLILNDGKIKIGSIELDMNPSEVNLDLENFEVLGSEVIAQTIIGTLSDVIFNTVKYTVVEKVSNKIKTMINKELVKIPLNSLIEKQSEVLFDDIVASVAKKIKNHVDPLKLPPFERQLQTTVLNMIPVNASIHVEQGKLYGLTTFSRMGDIFVSYAEESVIIEAEVGFQNLTGTYNWKMKVLGRGPSGSASLAIRKVTSYLRIRQHLRRGTVPKLEEFRVNDIDYVWIDMKGLGIWNHLLELIINATSNVFRLQIANLITAIVSKILQQSLDKAHFNVIP